MFENAGPEMTAFRKLNLLFRFSYTLPFVLATAVGLAFAAAAGASAPAAVWASVPVCAMLLGVFVNFSNDYFDHGNGVDAERFRSAQESGLRSDEVLRKLYWEGNQFDNGNVSEAEGRRLMVLIAALAVASAAPAVLWDPVPALAFGAAGLAFAYFYTAPPVNFGARGMGEALVAVSFFMLSVCPCYLLAGYVPVEAAVSGLIVATTVGLMRAVDSMTAQEVHIRLGERSVATMFGKGAVSVLVRLVIVFAYAAAAALAVLSHPAFLLEFLTLPVAAKAWRAASEMRPGWDFACAPLAFGTAVLSQAALAAAALLSVLRDCRGAAPPPPGSLGASSR